MDINWLLFFALYLFVLGLPYVLLVWRPRKSGGERIANRICYKNVQIISFGIGGPRKATAYYIAFQSPESQSPIEVSVDPQEYKRIQELDSDLLRKIRFDLIAERDSVLAIAPAA